MRTIIFDIETGPRPEAEIESLYVPLDPAEVKLGNIKDPEKVAAKIAEAQAKHRAAFFDGAALSAITGRVLAIGYGNDDPTDQEPLLDIAPDDEAGLLTRFWGKWRQARASTWCGFNILSFDLPFLIRRSWVHQVQVPADVRAGRYWHAGFLDLRDAWQMGSYNAPGSLDDIARLLGVGAKNGDGALFSKVLAENPDAAADYLRNDIEMTRAVWRRMFVEVAS